MRGIKMFEEYSSIGLENHDTTDQKAMMFKELYLHYKPYSFINVDDFNKIEINEGSKIIDSTEGSDIFRVRFNFTENNDHMLINNLHGFVRRIPLLKAMYDEINKLNSYDFYDKDHKSFMRYVKSLSRGVGFEAFKKFKENRIKEEEAPNNIVSFGYGSILSKNTLNKFTDDSIFNTSVSDYCIGLISSINNVPLYFYNLDDEYSLDRDKFMLVVDNKKPIFTIAITDSNLTRNNFENVYSLTISFKLILHTENITSKINIIS
jgi:hypothetical protein